MAISLAQIESEWSSYGPAGQRPLAGRRSLAGFNYQLSLSLGAFFKGLFSGDPAAAQAFEGMSDIAELSQGLLYVTQVKLTLSTERLKEAYLEFLVVDRFLEERFPEVREATRYRVLCSALRSRVREDLTAEELGLSDADGHRWEALRPRLLPFEVRGDPSLDLVLSLWSQVRRPYAFVTGLRGLLLERLSEGATSAAISRELVERLEGERVETPPPGTILSPADFADRSAGESDVLIGRRPSPDDIARGCFMEREHRLQPVVEKVLAALAAGGASRGGERRLQVVWIAGGSGTGKSVLLLQTLARLTGEADVPLHSLRHLVSQLPAALDFWLRQDQAAVVAVDDLFAPEFRGADLWQRIHEAAAASPPIVLVTCGPTDYLEAFERQEDRHGLLELQRLDLPPLDPGERIAYGTWYARRTGGAEVPQVRASNLTIASFLLERQRQGDADLGQFAARLAERLTAHGVAAEFLAALAANRLGVPAPMRLFEGRRDAFQRFIDEGLCQRRDVAGQQEAVLWFHQALANAIYEELVAAAAVEERALHLERFFQSLVDDPDAVKPFLDLLGKGQNPRLPEEVACEVLRKIGQALAHREPPNLKISLMFLWQAEAKARDLPVDRILPAQHLRRWMASPAVGAQGWGLLFQLYWERLVVGARNEAAGDAVEWLERNGELGEWSYVWRLLWKERCREANLMELARRWLGPHAASRAWSYVFQDLFDRGMRFGWLRDAAIQGLEKAPITMADPYLWREARQLGIPSEQLLGLLTRRLSGCRVPKLRSKGVQLIVELANQAGWHAVHDGLAGCQEEPGWSHLLRDLVPIRAAHLDHLMRIGRAWLAGREDRADWNYLWQGLLEQAPEDGALRAIGREWLTGREDRAEWSYILRRLLNLAPEDQKLRAAGRAWLAGREDRAEWSYTLRRLLELAPEDQELRATGRDWLAGREDRADWNYVWQRLVELAPEDKQLRAIGYDWLAGREDRANWSYVWQRLLELAPEDQSLRATGRTWLNGREDRAAWAYVWEGLWALAPEDQELRTTGRAWLNGREDRAEWTYIMRRLLELAPGDQELRTTGRAWLAGREDRADWSYLWQRLVELAPEDQQLRATGYAWLAGREDRADWNYVWQRLLELAPEDQSLRATGRAWLVGREDRADWAYVWKGLWALAPEDQELRATGLAWLNGREDRAEWSYIWQDLWRLSPDDRLRQQGEEWLRAHPRHLGAPHVRGALLLRPRQSR
jgi:hypothetical protein